MGKVSTGLSMSLDGFIAGPNDKPQSPLGDDVARRRALEGPHAQPRRHAGQRRDPTREHEHERQRQHQATTEGEQRTAHRRGHECQHEHGQRHVHGLPERALPGHRPDGAPHLAATPPPVDGPVDVAEHAAGSSTILLPTATADPFAAAVVALDALHTRAHELLWTAPCDLPAATVAVRAYQRALEDGAAS